MALAEIQVYIAASKNTRGTAEARLETCGDVVRTVIKAGAHKLKGKTVEAVVEHVTQTILKAGGGYYEHLTQHYLKALTALFEFQPNVERLKSNVWEQVIDFCVQGINTYLDDNDGELSRSFSGTGISNPPGSVAKSSHARSCDGSLTRQNVEEILQILYLLISASNAPLGTRYSTVGDSVIRLLKIQSSSASQLQQVAFRTLNIIVSFTREEQTSYCKSVAQEVFPVICRFWQGKALAKDEMLNSVRDEMLILLLAVHLHLERIAKDEDTPELLSTLEELLEAFKADYAKRSDRDQLQMDDLDMADFGKRIHDQKHPFCLYAFQLRPHNVKAERNWAILRSIGILERLMSIGQQRAKSPEDDLYNDVDRRPRKRQRVAHSPDRLLDLLRAKDESLRLAGLQTVPFVLQDSQLSATKLSELLTQLSTCAGDKRGAITSWALLAIARQVEKAFSIMIN